MTALLLRLKIGPRLGLAFGALMTLMALLIVTALVELDAVADDARRIASHETAKLAAALEVSGLVRANGLRAMEAVNTLDANRRATAVQGVAEAREQITALLAQLDQLVVRPEGRTLLAEYRKAREAYIGSLQASLALLKNGSAGEAQIQMIEQTLPLLGPVATAADRLVALQRRVIDEAAAHVDAVERQTRLVMLGLGLVAIGMAAALGLAITRSVVRPLGEAVSAAQRVAQGDLTVDLTSRGQDEVAELMTAMQAMQASLSHIVGEVRAGVDAVSTASSQIAMGNTDLSQRTEEQAANLQQTAASMEQLTATVSHNNDTAREASQIAAAAAHAVTEGGAVVAQVVTTMEAISGSSRRIGDIIGTIDGIAFQTNILALNAAVEAARAGEQGRGFAVVASEVRSLAQRSAEAAREIKSLVGGSLERVDEGSRQVADAGRVISDVVERVQRVSSLVSAISAASAEQNSGIGQVGQAVSQLDQVTQQNAALVEESAAAAESLKGQAQRLVDSVAVFRLA